MISAQEIVSLVKVILNVAQKDVITIFALKIFSVKTVEVQAKKLKEQKNVVKGITQALMGAA